LDPHTTHRSRCRARCVLGLAQYLHVHQITRRTARRRRDRNGAQHRSTEHRRISDVVPVSWLERRLHDNGSDHLPDPKLILDITPVDQVASVMLAVSAQACVEEPRLVFQAATGDANANNMERIIGLCGLDKRKYYEEKDEGVKILNRIAARMEPRTVTVSKFENTSVPMFNATAKKASSLLDRLRPRWGGGRVGEAIDLVKSSVERVEEMTRETTEAFDMFRPFTVENAYVFRSDNVRSLFDRIREDEQSLLTWNPEKFDWYDYWLNIHLPGLTKWVFP